MTIFKSLPLESVELRFEGNTRKFRGYASTFNGNDSYGDTILPGAYLKTLADNGMPKMFFAHDWGLPVGKWLSAVEDEKGLLVEGEDRKSTRLNSSHVSISYAVFCLKKKRK